MQTKTWFTFFLKKKSHFFPTKKLATLKNTQYFDIYKISLFSAKIIHIYSKMSLSNEHILMAHFICQTFRDCHTPAPIIWSRSNHNLPIISGVLPDVKFNPTYAKRKGGGFVFTLRYNDYIDDHSVILKKMLHDYTMSMKLIGRNVKNQIINPSKDISIISNNRHILFNKIFPWSVRELKNLEECKQWIIKQNFDSFKNSIQFKVKKEMMRYHRQGKNNYNQNMVLHYNIQ